MVFVTARFRTGSTLLWRLLRELPDLTANYEPFHPAHAEPRRTGETDPMRRGERSCSSIVSIFDWDG